MADRRMPADWEPCRRVFLAWPHNRETWPGRFSEVPGQFVRFAAAIAESTEVVILASEKQAQQHSRWVNQTAPCQWLTCKTDDAWVRDYGPTFVWETESATDDHLLAIDFRYNAWGQKYHPFDSDAAAAQTIAQHAGIRRQPCELTIEGGALETDGQGNLLVHSGCLLDPARNRGADRSVIAARLGELLGTREILWLQGGAVPGDDTDGHIDQIARFLSPDCIVVAVAPDDFDVASRQGLLTNYRQIQSWADSQPRKVNVHQLPMPPRRVIQGQPVPQSYCNFLRLGPDRLLVPTFGDRLSDDAAVSKLRELIPSVEVTGVASDALAWGLGSLHCLSCQQPSEAFTG